MIRSSMLVLFALALLACSDSPRHVAVIFPEAGGLKPGDNVSIRGLAIGQVRDVDLHPEGVIARLEISPRFVAHLGAGARFTIESEKLVTGKKAVVVQPGEPPGAALPEGAVVHGEALPPGPLEEARQVLEGSVDRAGDQAKGLGRALLDPDTLPPRAAGGTVDLDRPGHYRLRLISVRVEPTTADGSSWDSMGEPDLLVQAWVGPRQVLLTPTADDTESKTFGDEGISASFELQPGQPVRLKVLDADVSYHDEIGIIELQPTPADARAGRTFRLAAGRVAELQLVIEEAPPEPLPPVADAGLAKDAAP